MQLIVINQTIQWLETEVRPSECFDRIIWFDDFSVVVIRLHEDKAWPRRVDRSVIDLAISSGEARLVDFTNEKFLIPDKLMSEAAKRTRDRAYAVIKDIINPDTTPRAFLDIHYFRQLAKKASKVHGCCDASIYKWVRKFLWGGMVPNALSPALENCGTPSRKDENGDPIQRNLQKKQGRPSNANKVGVPDANIVITDEIKRNFAKGVSLYWQGGTGKKRLSKVFEYILGKFFTEGYIEKHGIQKPVLLPLSKLPTLAQFRYWYKQSRQKDYRKVRKSEAGERTYNLQLRELLGNSTMETFGPGSHYQIDATKLDCYVLSRDRKKIIGRPTFYIVVDVYTRMIVGFYVGLEGPSWLGAMQAIYNAARDKVEWYQQYGIEITKDEFPVAGLPWFIIADRGEMVGQGPDNLMSAFNIDIQNTGSWRPDLKGIVERYFRTLQGDALEWDAGRVYKEYWNRDVKDYRLDTQFTIEEITKIFMYAVLYRNTEYYLDSYPKDRSMLEEEIEPVPLQLWQWGLSRFAKLRQYTDDIMKMNLLPSSEATITETGILFKNVMYGSEKAIEESRFMQAREQGRIKKIPISYDPRNLQQIYWRLNGGMGYEVCTMLGTSLYQFDGMSMEEIELRLYNNEIVSKTTGRAKKMSSGASFQEAIQGIQKGAKEKNKKVRQENDLHPKKMVKGMREAHAEEKQNGREQEQIVLPGSKGKKPQAAPMKKEEISDNEYLDLI
ncbi:MAG: Integrase catalytic region [Firmicutes bacterium]|nr:Integrase catalytic region [Bacillota bacterium]